MTHILVTRPLESSEQLARQLDALGLFPIVMPFYTFAARKPVVDKRSAGSEKGRRKLLVFTSPRAVEFGLAYVPARDQLDDLELAVVGSATRAALESSGYPVHLQSFSGFTSEDLLQIPGLADNPGVAVIYCAPGGRETLALGLEGLGWRTVKALVYERVPLQPDSGQLENLRNAGNLISIWTSNSAIKLAKQCLPKDVWGKILASPALVISSRIQQYLMQVGAGSVELADGPGNPDLLKSILRMTGRQNSG